MKRRGDLLWPNLGPDWRMLDDKTRLVKFFDGYVIQTSGAFWNPTVILSNEAATELAKLLKEDGLA